MIVKFHARGVGRGSGPVGYLLGPDGAREGATLDRGDPALIEFTDATPGRRSVTLPVAAALPVLSRAHTSADAHPSVALLSGAALLGGRPLRASTVLPMVRIPCMQFPNAGTSALG